MNTFQGPPVTDSPEWKLWAEFPPPPLELKEPTWSTPSNPIFTTVPESLVEDVIPRPEEEILQPEENPEKIDVNDWELKLLVKQFDESILMQNHSNKGRRHSSGEALSWDNVLHLRNTSVKAKKQSSSAAFLGGTATRRKFSLVEEGSLWRTKTPEATSISESNSYSSLANIGGRPPHSIVENTSGNCYRRKSVSHISTNPFLQEPPPTGRKSSLPTLPQQQFGQHGLINMARWMSMDQVKDKRNHEYSQQNSMSSTCSQETVIEMDTKFSSVDNVNHYSDASMMGVRSPSSPNVATDRDLHMSLDFSSANRLSDWPSSPCLPTIREDDQNGGANTPSKSSPGRSVSHDCLPSRKAATVQQNHYDTDIGSQDFPDFYNAFDSFDDQENDQSDDDDLKLIPQTQNLTSDNTYYPGPKTTNVSTASALGAVASLKDTNPRSISQSSVAITIPDYEHQF